MSKPTNKPTAQEFYAVLEILTVTHRRLNNSPVDNRVELQAITTVIKYIKKQILKETLKELGRN